ncbi:hypothetical protein C0J52_23062, partial [Blattella germanica]
SHLVIDILRASLIKREKRASLGGVTVSPGTLGYMVEKGQFQISILLVRSKFILMFSVLSPTPWLSGLRQCALVPSHGTCIGSNPHGGRNFHMDFVQYMDWCPPINLRKLGSYDRVFHKKSKSLKTPNCSVAPSSRREPPERSFIGPDTSSVDDAMLD